MKTELVIVVDRSGSMRTKASSATEGVNNLIENQRGKDGYCRLTLVEFDSEYNVVYSGDIEKAPKYNLISRGQTKLHDAIGRTIESVQKRITKTGKKYRPDLMTFTVVTDGLENASRKYSYAQVQNMIDNCKKNGWQFTYLCNDVRSEEHGSSLGFNSVFKFNQHKYKEAYEALSFKTDRLREVVRSGASKEVITQTNQFTMAEKEIMK